MSEFILIGARTGTLEFLREHLSHLSPMTRFIAGTSAVFVMPHLSRRLKLPHVTLVGVNTLDPAGHHLIDGRVLNAVFVLMLSTSILGPVMTQRYAPGMLPSQVKRAK